MSDRINPGTRLVRIFEKLQPPPNNCANMIHAWAVVLGIDIGADNRYQFEATALVNLVHEELMRFQAKVQSTVLDESLYKPCFDMLFSMVDYQRLPAGITTVEPM